MHTDLSSSAEQEKWLQVSQVSRLLKRVFFFTYLLCFQRRDLVHVEEIHSFLLKT